MWRRRSRRHTFESVEMWKKKKSSQDFSHLFRWTRSFLSIIKLKHLQLPLLTSYFPLSLAFQKFINSFFLLLRLNFNISGFQVLLLLFFPVQINIFLFLHLFTVNVRRLVPACCRRSMPAFGVRTIFREMKIHKFLREIPSLRLFSLYS